MRLNPDDTRALYMGANGLVALGERAEGLEWARQALAADPDEPMVLYNVACIQSLAGRGDEAMDSNHVRGADAVSGRADDVFSGRQQGIADVESKWNVGTNRRHRSRDDGRAENQNTGKNR